MSPGNVVTACNLSQSVLSAIVGADPDVVVVRDASDSLRWVSPSVESILGWRPADYDTSRAAAIHPTDRPLHDRGLIGARHRPGDHHIGMIRHRTADGTWVVMDVTATNLLDEHDVLITRYRPVAPRRTPIEHGPVVLDEVTGVPGRSVARHALAERIERTTGAVAVLFLDLDGFKAVNDRFGHGVGDRVLRQVADRLQDRLRASEFLARWGGDEFLVLVDVPGPALAATVAARLHRAVTEQPFGTGSASVRLGVSIGVALAGARGDADDAVHAADRAMYEAKRAGGGVVTAATA